MESKELTVADRIRLRREELGMSQDELAMKIGTKGRSGISRIENSGDDVTMKNVVRIATALSTTPRYLMGYEDAPAESNKYTTLNQIYHVLKRDKEFDDKAIPLVFGFDDEEQMKNHIKNYGPIIIPYSRVMEIADIYNLSPEYLIGFTNERRPVSFPTDETYDEEEDEVEIKNVTTVYNPNLLEEIELIKAYRKASEEAKSIILKILDVKEENEENKKPVLKIKTNTAKKGLKLERKDPESSTPTKRLSRSKGNPLRQVLKPSQQKGSLR